MVEIENQILEKEHTELETTFVEKYRSLILALVFGLPVVVLFFYPVLFEDAGTGYFVDTFSFVFIYAALALTLNLEVGYLGLPNFGKVAFVMIGAYTYGFVEEAGIHWFGSIWFTGLILAMIVTGLSGILLTLPTLRLKEDYFAIVTIVAGEILRLIANNEPDHLGGFSGFPVTNIVYESHSVDYKLGGVYLEPITFALFVIILSISLGSYIFYKQRYSSIYSDPVRINNYALQKATTFSVIAGIVMLYLNFDETITTASLSLDLFVILLPIMIIILRYILNFFSHVLLERKAFEFTIYSFYAGVVVVALIDLLFGLSSNHGASQIGVVNWYFMILTAVIMLFVYVLMEEIYYSPFGRTLRSIREDDTSATAIGKSIFTFRLKGLIVSNALTGLVGAIYGWLLANVSPQSFLPILTFLLYIMVIIGGSGNNKGVIYGAIIIQLLYQTTRRLNSLDIYYPYTSRRLSPSNWALIIVGITLIIFLIYAPEGIFPERRDHNERYLDLLYLNDETPEEMEQNPMLNTLMRIARTDGQEIAKEELY